MRWLNVFKIVEPTQSVRQQRKRENKINDLKRRIESNFNFGSIIRWLAFHWSEENLFPFNQMKIIIGASERACAHSFAWCSDRMTMTTTPPAPPSLSSRSTSFYFFTFLRRSTWAEPCFNVFFCFFRFCFVFCNSFSSVSFQAENSMLVYRL